MRHKIKLAVLGILTALAVAMATTVPAFAQASGSTAEVRGQVTDSTGAVIPGAKVTLTDLNKGTARTATTDAEGNYTFLGLLPSPYDLKVEAKGFTASSGGSVTATTSASCTLSTNIMPSIATSMRPCRTKVSA